MKERKLSKGHQELFEIVKSLLPNDPVVVEHHLGERLFLDIYCPSKKIGFEFHGRQHFEFVLHFHGTYDDFLDSIRRDERKAALCKEQGISLVVFTYEDVLTKDLVFSKMIESLNETPAVELPQKPSRKNNEFYEAAKQRNREYRKKLYQQMKERRKNYAIIQEPPDPEA